MGHGSIGVLNEKTNPMGATYKLTAPEQLIMSESLDPAISEVPSDETLADALARATDVDRELALNIIQALSGGRAASRDMDSFNRQLRHRLEQAYLSQSRRE